VSYRSSIQKFNHIIRSANLAQHLIQASNGHVGWYTTVTQI
jgi:hypothetical protein